MEVFENKSFNRLNFYSLTREGFDTHIRLCLFFFNVMAGSRDLEQGRGNRDDTWIFIRT